MPISVSTLAIFESLTNLSRGWIDSRKGLSGGRVNELVVDKDLVGKLDIHVVDIHADLPTT